MKLPNLLTIIFLSALITSCSTEITSKDFNLNTKSKQKNLVIGSSFELILENSKQHSLDSVVFYHENNRLNSGKITLPSDKVGRKSYYAKIYIGNQKFIATTSIQAVSKTAPKLMAYEIVNEYPHDIKAYTQGLEFHQDTLYEGTGRRGISQLRKVHYKTGEVLLSLDLSPEHFGEGITIMNDQIYQLTWQANLGFVYDINNFTPVKTFNYGKSKEGWGLCNDGELIYKSDGTEKIWTLDPNTLEEKDFIQVYTNLSAINRLNELEYINGKIFANIYQENGIAVIDPKTGIVSGVIDGTPLQKKVTQHPDLDVLNGIAYNPKTGTIFVTGKNWDKLFEIRLK
jgi:glutamine cyclotransferase